MECGPLQVKPFTQYEAGAFLHPVTEVVLQILMRPFLTRTCLTEPQRWRFLIRHSQVGCGESLISLNLEGFPCTRFFYQPGRVLIFLLVNSLQTPQ